MSVEHHLGGHPVVEAQRIEALNDAPDDVWACFEDEEETLPDIPPATCADDVWDAFEDDTNNDSKAPYQGEQTLLHAPVSTVSFDENDVVTHKPQAKKTKSDYELVMQLFEQQEEELEQTKQAAAAGYEAKQARDEQAVTEGRAIWVVDQDGCRIPVYLRADGGFDIPQNLHGTTRITGQSGTVAAFQQGDRVGAQPDVKALRAPSYIGALRPPDGDVITLDQLAAMGYGSAASAIMMGACPLDGCDGSGHGAGAMSGYAGLGGGIGPRGDHHHKDGCCSTKKGKEAKKTSKSLRPKTTGTEASSGRAGTSGSSGGLFPRNKPLSNQFGSWTYSFGATKKAAA